MVDQVFDDGSEVEVYCPPENPGLGDHGDMKPTEEEAAAGEFLGLVIDPDDDSDNGSQWGTVDNPTMTADDFSALEGWTKDGPPS